MGLSRGPSQRNSGFFEDKRRDRLRHSYGAGPLVRSSYRAGRLYAQAMAHHGRAIPEAMAHLAAEGTATQEAGAVLERFGSQV